MVQESSTGSEVARAFLRLLLRNCNSDHNGIFCRSHEVHTGAGHQVSTLRQITDPTRSQKMDAIHQFELPQRRTEAEWATNGRRVDGKDGRFTRWITRMAHDVWLLLYDQSQRLRCGTEENDEGSAENCGR